MSNISNNQDSANGVNASFGGNDYFRAENEEIAFLGAKNTPYTKLKPKGNGIVDVYKDMYWSNLGNKSEVPQIFVVEKELKYGVWATQLSNLLTEGGKFAGGVGAAAANNFGADVNVKNVDSFLQLYSSENTGFYYNFPWLLKNGDGLRSVDNSWNSTGGIGDLLKGQADTAKKSGLEMIAAAGVGAAIGALTPGFGFEDTKQYSETTPQSVTITFPLYNTLDLESAFKHFSFVNLFTFQNLKTRTSLMTFIPPKIYEVDAFSAGGLYMAVAYVSNFKVDSIGTTRRLSDFGAYGPKEILLPEAYRVSITFTDLLSQSSNVFAGTMGGTKIKVADGGELIDAVKEFGNTAADAIVGGVKGAYNVVTGRGANNPNMGSAGPQGNTSNASSFGSPGPQ